MGIYTSETGGSWGTLTHSQRFCIIRLLMMSQTVFLSLDLSPKF